MIETGYPRLVLEAGEPAQARTAGTLTKLVEVVTARQAYGWSPEELAC